MFNEMWEQEASVPSERVDAFKGKQILESERQ